MKKNILIVDDFKNSLHVTSFTLEMLGFKVLKADSGERALEILKSNNPIDLIITDFNMPGMTGLDLIKAVRELKPNTHLPIFVLSTEAKEEVKQSVLSAGASAWIRKPFKTDILVKYIRQAVGE